MRTDKKKDSARQLYIYQSLLTGRTLNKQNLATHFNVTERAIQRDVSDIKAFLANEELHQSIHYSRSHHGYQLLTDQHELSAQEILVLAKILLASRAFPKTELDQMIAGLLRLIKADDRKAVAPIIKNETFWYVPVHHGQLLRQRLWDFSQAIRQHQTLEITYLRRDQEKVTRTIFPEAIIFSEYYFYIASYNETYGATLFYRADRIQNYHAATTKITRTRAQRFEDGEFRQRIQFMYPGSVQKISFQFWGIVEAALDRLPTAKVTHRWAADGTELPINNSDYRQQQPRDGGSVTIEAEVFGERGVMMWLLSQGALVKVLSPQSLVTALQAELEQIQARYH